MKAIQMTDFGDSSVLKMQTIDRPVPSASQILIKIAATTVNPLDMKIRSGAMQQFMPVSIPYLPGNDLAGTVEEIGKDVTRLKKGDQVFATTFGGTYCEYIVLEENIVSIIPNGTTLNQAASLATPLSVAYSLLVEAAELQSGQRILIHGAGGSVGAIVVQMAKALGAHVIGTATGNGIKKIESMGADEVIDYRSDDFTELVSDVDVVIDLVGGDTLNRSYSLIKKGGKLFSIVAFPSQEVADIHGISASFITLLPSLEKLMFGKKLVEEEKIIPHIAAVLKLEDAANAQDLVAAGNLYGKVILEVHE